MTDDTTSQAAVVIERNFEAPPDLIWQMWTDPEHFKAWYGPAGVTIPVAEMDVRAGGSRLVCMQMDTPGGLIQMWFTGEYREVVKNHRLSYTESMSDEFGNVLPSTQVTVEFEDLGGRTKMVLTHTGIAAGSAGAAGWTMALDKLAAHPKVQEAASGITGMRA
jgi:uncharacterized protein YndB with AHSA1/START domain